MIQLKPFRFRKGFFIDGQTRAGPTKTAKSRLRLEEAFLL
jgi:hypothetical protein